MRPRSLLLIAGFAPGAAYAVPGPDSVAVVANRTVPESAALAARYAAARDIPSRQVCLLDISTDDTIDLADYEADFAAALELCLMDAGVLPRIEALVLAKGLPLRVRIPTEGGNQRASLAAVAATWKSATTAGQPLTEIPPGVQADCGGTPCLLARYSNPFRQGLFEAGWTRRAGGVIWQPLIVTALEGRSFQDAAKLVASATTSEARAPVTGDFVFMRGRDPARGVLDAEFPELVEDLQDLGFDAEIVPFNLNLEGRDLAALFVGTATLSRTIEGNRYAPGSLVDNLTSFGAVPLNFEPTGESQVSIARWVARGVAGVHGTTDEPLNNVFPSRRLIVDYAAGGTLGEAYFRRLPAAYWRNLVLGDPMTAPYAVRPVVTIEGLSSGETLVGARELTVRAIDPLDRGIASLKLFVDGVLVDEAADGVLTTCVIPPDTDDLQVLAVAQVADDFTPAGFHRPKGWAATLIDGRPGPTDCEELVDAGPPDASAPDQGPPDASPLDGGSVEDASAPTSDAGSIDAGVADAKEADGGPMMPDGADGGCRCGQPATNPLATASLLAFFGIMVAGTRRSSSRSRR